MKETNESEILGLIEILGVDQLVSLTERIAMEADRSIKGFAKISELNQDYLTLCRMARNTMKNIAEVMPQLEGVRDSFIDLKEEYDGPEYKAMLDLLTQQNETLLKAKEKLEKSLIETIDK